METQPAKPHTLESFVAPIESLVREVIQHGGFELTFVIRDAQSVDIELEATELVVDFSGPDVDLLLESNADLLNALEYVVLKAVRLAEELFGKITFDCRDWRRLRAQELKLTAQLAADRVVETGDPFSLGPMTPRERRIIHLALKGQPRVQTMSQGVGTERRVVILPASHPARPVRNIQR